MRGIDLFEILGSLSPQYITEAENPVRVINFRRRIAVLCAAVLCFYVIGIILISSVFQDKNNSHISSGIYSSDSDKTISRYTSVEDIREAINNNDIQNQLMGSAFETKNITFDGEEKMKFSNAAFYNGYCYRCEYYALDIYSQDSDGSKAEASITTSSSKKSSVINGGLCIIDNRLLLISVDMTNYNTFAVIITMYSLSDPLNPVPLCTYKQGGNLNSVFFSDGKIILFTSHDTGIPAFYQNDKELSRDNSEITILGEPLTYQYTAYSVIDPSDLTISDKHIFFGDISHIFFDKNHMEISTKGLISGESEYECCEPDVYFFGNESYSNYLGKIDCSEVLNIAKKFRVSFNSDSITDAFVSRVWKNEDRYIIVGYINFKKKSGLLSKNSNSSTELFVINADIKNMSGDITRQNIGNEKLKINEEAPGKNKYFLLCSGTDYQTMT